MVTATQTPSMPANHVPTGDCENEWTLEITPLRVMKVPRIANKNVETTSTTFHLRSMPRFSWIMIECRNAVPVSHGRNDAFSTGSHAQYPPHPSSTYAHHMPRQMPMERKSQERMVHFRIATSQSTS